MGDVSSKIKDRDIIVLHSAASGHFLRVLPNGEIDGLGNPYDPWSHFRILKKNSIQHKFQCVANPEFHLQIDEYGYTNARGNPFSDYTSLNIIYPSRQYIALRSAKHKKRFVHVGVDAQGQVVHQAGVEFYGLFTAQIVMLKSTGYVLENPALHYGVAVPPPPPPAAPVYLVQPQVQPACVVYPAGYCRTTASVPPPRAGQYYAAPAPAPAPGDGMCAKGCTCGQQPVAAASPSYAPSPQNAHVNCTCPPQARLLS